MENKELDEIKENINNSKKESYQAQWISLAAIALSAMALIIRLVEVRL